MLELVIGQHLMVKMAIRQAAVQMLIRISITIQLLMMIVATQDYRAASP
jgi:hypothetical protein